MKGDFAFRLDFQGKWEGSSLHCMQPVSFFRMLCIANSFLFCPWVCCHLFLARGECEASPCGCGITPTVIHSFMIFVLIFDALGRWTICGLSHPFISLYIPLVLFLCICWVVLGIDTISASSPLPFISWNQIIAFWPTSTKSLLDNSYVSLSQSSYIHHEPQ